METLNLNTLASSLPTAHQNAEKELLNNFKAAALSITTLYRSSRQTSKRAYNSGYAAACQDLLTMIQQGVSVGDLNPSGSSHDSEGGGMTIGRVMDWTEARLDAIKSRQEEEDEEEEREREKERGRPATAAATAPPSSVPKPEVKVAKAAAPTTSASRPNNQPSSLPTPNSPRSNHNGQLPAEPSSPSPPPAPSTALRSIQRQIKSRPIGKGDAMAQYSSPTITTHAPNGFDFVSDNILPITPPAGFSDAPLPIAAGAKRRHAMMMMLDSASSSVSSASTAHPSPTSVGALNAAHNGGATAGGRRRTRSSRNSTAHQQPHNLIQAATEAMDVEEDGRERKRVARR